MGNCGGTGERNYESGLKRRMITPARMNSFRRGFQKDKRITQIILLTQNENAVYKNLNYFTKVRFL